MRRAGLAARPEWLIVESGHGPRIGWWSVTRTAGHDAPDAGGLAPRLADGRGPGPRGVILASVDLERAARELLDLVDGSWEAIPDDPVLGARCLSGKIGAGRLILVEPLTEGYAAAYLARWSEGPIGVAVDTDGLPDKVVPANPISDGPAGWVRVGGPSGPWLLLSVRSSVP